VAEPTWVERLVVDAVHLDQIREHGGLAGLRDEHALEAALARPRQKWHYQPDTNLPTLAAAYGFGLSRSHPYHDGNKRVAFVVMVVFLELNGWRFAAEEVEVVRAMVALAAGRLTEKALAEWLDQHSTKPRGR
jgi:death-on-curing protein